MKSLFAIALCALVSSQLAFAAAPKSKGGHGDPGNGKHKKGSTVISGTVGDDYLDFNKSWKEFAGSANEGLTDYELIVVCDNGKKGKSQLGWEYLFVVENDRLVELQMKRSTEKTIDEYPDDEACMEVGMPQFIQDMKDKKFSLDDCQYELTK